MEINIKAKIKGDAGLYEVWGIDLLHQRILVNRNCGYEWVDMERVTIRFFS